MKPVTLKSSLVVVLLCALCIAYGGCASFFANAVQVTGKVRLSDNPSSGHGGVLVRTELRHTISAPDGSFLIEGDITYNEESFYIGFHMAGYQSVQKLVTAKKSKDSREISLDVGTVTLTKI